MPSVAVYQWTDFFATLACNHNYQLYCFED